MAVLVKLDEEDVRDAKEETCWVWLKNVGFSYLAIITKFFSL